MAKTLQPFTHAAAIEIPSPGSNAALHLETDEDSYSISGSLDVMRDRRSLAAVEILIENLQALHAHLAGQDLPETAETRIDPPVMKPNPFK